MNNNSGRTHFSLMGQPVGRSNYVSIVQCQNCNNLLMGCYYIYKLKPICISCKKEICDTHW